MGGYEDADGMWQHAGSRGVLAARDLRCVGVAFPNPLGECWCIESTISMSLVQGVFVCIGEKV